MQLPCSIYNFFFNSTLCDNIVFVSNKPIKFIFITYKKTQTSNFDLINILLFGGGRVKIVQLLVIKNCMLLLTRVVFRR